MDTHYLEIEDQVYERRKQLNILHWLRLSSTFSISITFLYLVLFYFGAVEMIQPWWILILFNLFAVGAGWLIGKSRPIRVEKDLFVVDRAFRFGEKLTTIFYLREIRTAPVFLEALYRKVGSLRPNIKDALTLSDRDQRGWMALGGLVFACGLVLVLWGSGLNPSSAFWGSGNSLGQSPLDSSLILNDDQVRDLEDILRDGKTAEENNGLDGEKGDENCPPPQTSVQSAERAIRNEIFASTNCETGSDSPSLEELFNNEERPEQQPNTLSQELASLLAQMMNGQMSPQEASQQLQQLANQLPPGAMQDLLNELSEMEDLDELVDRMQEAFKEAKEQETENNDLANNDPSGTAQGSPQNGGLSGEYGSDFLDANDPNATNPNGSEGVSSNASQSLNNGNDQNNNQSGTPNAGQQGNSQSGSSENGEGTGQGSGQGSGEGEEEGSSQGAGEQAGGGSGEETADGANSEGGVGGQSGRSTPQSGGSGVGQSPGDGRESAGEMDRIERDNSVYISSGQLPADVELLNQLISSGLPVDLEEEQREGSRQIRLNSDAVESIMDTRDLPPQLKALVRRYFLAITGER